MSWAIILLLLSHIALILIINLVIIIEELILKRKHISRHSIFTNNALCCRVVKLKKFTSFFDPYSFHLGHLNELLPLVRWHKPILVEFRTCLALGPSYFIARMIIFFILIWRGMFFTLNFSKLLWFYLRLQIVKMIRMKIIIPNIRFWWCVVMMMIPSFTRT